MDIKNCRNNFRRIRVTTCHTHQYGGRDGGPRMKRDLAFVALVFGFQNPCGAQHHEK